MFRKRRLSESVVSLQAKSRLPVPTLPSRPEVRTGTVAGRGELSRNLESPLNVLVLKKMPIKPVVSESLKNSLTS
jgi:hypothetical protein